MIKTTELGLHTQFTGEILDIKIDEKFYNNGNPDVKQITPFFHDPASQLYYDLGEKLEKSIRCRKRTSVKLKNI